MSHVVLVAYPIKLNISTKNTVIKVLPKTLCIGFSFNDLGKLQMTNFILTKFAIIIQFSTRRCSHIQVVCKLIKNYNVNHVISAMKWNLAIAAFDTYNITV